MDKVGRGPSPPKMKPWDILRRQIAYARVQWNSGMKATWHSRHGCPAVLVNGEQRLGAVLGFAMDKGAYKPGADRGGYYFCLEFDPSEGPVLLTGAEVSQRLSGRRSP